MKNTAKQSAIFVFADWIPLKKAELVGILHVAQARGKEIFSFEYSKDWIINNRQLALDPLLQFFTGPQYPKSEHPNFGVFLDSSPDRWGRLLMRRREEQMARIESRSPKTLLESDYMMGVFDSHRMGGLRFKRDPNGPFLDNNQELASPPWTKLKDLEQAAAQLEKSDAIHHKNYNKWLSMLIAPGGSLGGARPKASVLDSNGHPWIAKFPSLKDDINIGGWEYLVYQLAKLSNIQIAESQIKKFNSSFDTFITKRFDRQSGQRIHFASAMTMLNRQDGDHDASYLEVVDFLIKHGSQVQSDLEELWKRIVFNICVSNTDDHLRNHGFLLTDKGWKLAPAYDINPSESANGLTLNISENDNSQNTDLALAVADYFRLSPTKAKTHLSHIKKAISNWKALAKRKFPSSEIERMRHAFRVVE